jgi:glycosyltransferase involved in cell wall biosynthesis
MTWLTTAQGGAERSTLELAGGLSKILGVEVTVVWCDLGRDPFPPRPPAGVRLRYTACLDAYEQELADELDRRSGETLVITTHRTVMVDVLLAKQRQAHVIAVLRGILVSGQRLRTVHPVLRELVPHRPDEMDWDILSLVDRWVGVSRSATRSLVAHAERPLRAVTIYNGVAVPAHTRVRTGQPSRQFSVVARTEPWKQIDQVIMAYAALPRDVASGLRLNVFGTGTALSALRDLARRTCPDREVRFLGHLPDEDWVAGTDVLISACDIEGFGRCVVEAGAAGIPQIVPDSGGSAELVVPKLTGLVFRSGDVPALTEAMCQAAKWSATELRGFGRRAHVHARSYSQTRYFFAYARLAVEVCAANQAGRLPELTDV